MTQLNDGFLITNAGVSNNGPFNVIGGAYALAVVGTVTGSQLFTMGPDGATQVAVGAAANAPVYQSPIYLDPGVVFFNITAGSGVYASLSRIRLS